MNSELVTAGNLCECTGNSGEPVYAGECEITSSPSPLDEEEDDESGTTDEINEPALVPSKDKSSQTSKTPKNAKEESDNSAIMISSFDETEEISSTQTPVPSTVPQLDAEMGDNIVCSTEERPVCCKYADGTEETKSNSCFCRASFGTISSESPCAKSPLPSLIATSNPMPCNDNDPPVCCRNSSTGEVKTVANVCVCEVEKSTVLYFGECTF